MSEAIVFNQGRPLDFEDVRSQIARIPEVMLRLREAQKIWEELGLSSKISFYETLISDDKSFFSSSAFRSLLSAIVHIGLYDRMIKSAKSSEFIVGNIRNDSATRVITGQISFRELIQDSRASTAKSSDVSGLHVLQGQEFPLYQAYRMVDGTYIAVGEDCEDLNKVLSALVESFGVRNFVSVGPGSVDRSNQEGLLSEVSFAESIDRDPLLGWFWQNVKSMSASA